jgi:hypothetical protein|tara:strand:+ start:3675 stop:4397 length:723 start_codon:yes stop_codon:yes gene_type:complete
MTTPGGLAVMDVFLRRTLANNATGLCFEFGTYKGRTAVFILQSLGDSSWLHAVEQSDYLQTSLLNEISSTYTWHKEKSEGFCEERLPSLVGDKNVAFSHHDASHFFSNVKSELSGIINFMSPTGVIVLDDFNDDFSQVRAAYYYLRFVQKFPFELLLTGFNKAVLVHQDMFDEFEDYVLSGLMPDMAEAGIPTKLSRTDINEHSRNFYLAGKAAADPEERYGEKFFGDTFYQPSRHKLSR